MQAETAQDMVQRVVDAYSDMLLRIALHYTKNPSDAEDAVQTVFIKLMNAAPQFADEKHEKAWLIRVTINQCKDFLRSAWNRKTVGLAPELLGTLPAAQPEDNTEVLDAVRALPEKYRATVFLYYYEGYSTVEIARLMDLPQNTVESRLFRARARLKTMLEGAWDDE